MPVPGTRSLGAVRRWLGPCAFAALLALTPGCEEGAGGTTPGTGGSDGGAGGSDGGTASSGGASMSTSTSTSSSSSTGSGGSGGEAPQPATFEVVLDDANAAVDLNDTLEITASIVPNGYVGPVAVTFALMDTGIGSGLDTTMVTLDGSTTATAKLTLTTLTSTPPGERPFSVSGHVATGSKSAAGTITVKSAITVVIPKNANQLAGTVDNPYKLAFGEYPIVITAPAGISDQNPVTVRFYNDDSVAHEIHANQGGSGFPHDPGPIAPNSMNNLVRKVNAAGTYNFYLHDQNAVLTVGRIVIQ